MKKKAKVYITTWPKGQNHGSVIPLAIHDMEITIQAEQVTCMQGCCSLEVCQEKDLPTVIIGGRKFICNLSDSSISYLGVEYAVLIPRDLADTLKTCPHCNTLL